MMTDILILGFRPQIQGQGFLEVGLLYASHPSKNVLVVAAVGEQKKVDDTCGPSSQPLVG